MFPPARIVCLTEETVDSGIFVDTNAMHEGRRQTNTGPAHAGSRLKLSDALGRRRPKCHPSSRTGENPPYGDRGDVGIIRSPVRASILPDCGGRPVTGVPTAIICCRFPKTEPEGGRGSLPEAGTATRPAAGRRSRE